MTKKAIFTTETRRHGEEQGPVFNFGNSGDFGNFLFINEYMAPPSAWCSSVQSEVQKVFPRLLIEMFSSQMRSYTKLLFDAKDCQ